MTLNGLIVVIVTTATLASVVGASAASLGGVSGSVVAGDSAIPACDTDGLTLTYATTGGNVTAVTVSALADPGCEGGELSLTLSNAAGGSIAGGGPTTIAVDGDTADNAVTVPVAPNPTAEAVAGYRVSIVGP